MHLTVQRADLARALAYATRVVERRNTIPILANVLLDATSDGLRIRATDLDMEITTTVAADVTKPGSTTVDATKLADIAKRVGGDSIALSLDDGRLVAKSGRSKVTLPTIDPRDFPTLNVGEFDVEFEADLAALVAPVAYAQSTEPTRYYLNGVFLHAPRGTVVVCATDSHRLARRGTELAVAVPASILPSKFVAAMPKGAGRVALSRTKVRVTTDDVVLVSKLIDGTFPDYERVIPEGNPHTVSVTKDNLRKAAELAMSVSDQKSRAVRLDIAPGSIALSSRGSGGDAAQELEAEYSGEPFAVGINGQYLCDTLAAFGGAEVQMRFADPGSPILFTTGGDLTAVCMPIRVQ